VSKELGLRLSFKPLFCLILIVFASHSNQKQTQGVIMVGGALRPTTYTVTSTQKALFTRENYHLKAGKISQILGTNSLRIDTGIRSEEFSLIGLMDFSPETNGKLRRKIMKILEKSYAGRQAMIYVPRNYRKQGLRHNHAYIITQNQLINSEVLRKGWGILPPSQDFSPTLQLAFSKIMNEAMESRKGLWGR
jgi:hypothetical protein